jgi:DNA-binding transcriptional ArsR family regulator
MLSGELDMFQEFAALDGIQVQILINLRKHDHKFITELIRALKLGGDTFYRHKQALVEGGLIREIVNKDSRIRTVRLELTCEGTQVAILLEELAVMLERTKFAKSATYRI